MTEELYVCVPIDAVQDCGDHAVAVLGRLQALCMEAV